MTGDDREQFDTLLRAVARSPHVVPASGNVLVGRFRLTRRLGEGGFGVVYEAEDQRDGARVALKMLRCAEADWLYRFKREFRALQGLVHPNLVVLDELFGVDGRWFFTMELVDGIDFISYAQGALPTPWLGGSHVSEVREARAPDPSREPASATTPARSGAFLEARLRNGLRQLFEGLSVLHIAGKVHRDIKPANVLVTQAGRVVLIDFGLITNAFDTMESAAVGTPAYMAPEQVASRKVGPAADLYAAGVILYEVLTGRLPFAGAPLQILIDKQASEPPPPAALVAGIPADLNALAVALLRVDPTRRPSALEVCRSLDGARTTPTPAPSTDAPAFVGRLEELAQLRAAFETSTRGRLQMVIITGESGIGKSHLIRRFAEQVVSKCPEAIVLQGRCHEREAVPYKALDGIMDALSRRFSRMLASDVAALLPTHPAMLARLFPVMLRVPQLARERATTESRDEPQDLRQRAFLALRDLFARIALDRPTIIALDDLQWADEDGMKALAEILRPPDPPPLLFVGTLRAGRDGREAALARFRGAIPGEVRVIDLASLSNVEAREFAARLLARAGVTGVDPERVATDAGGHPLFMEELARQAALGRSVHGEVRLDDAIWARIVDLDGPARALAELVAVAGKPLPQGVAAAAALMEPARFQRDAALLRASSLLRTSGTQWADAIEPYHDRVREAVLDRLTPMRHRELHATLAVAFEGSAHVDAEALAWHWREAGDASRAARFAEEAGDQASRIFAFAKAAAWFRQALELHPENDTSRRALHIKLGEALAFAGRGALAAPEFEAAATASDAVDAVDLRRRAAEQFLRSGLFDRGMEACHVVLAGIGVRFPATRFQAFVAYAYYGLLLRLRGLKLREKGTSEISNEVRTRMSTCWSIGFALTFVDPFPSLVLLRRALLLALAAGDLDRVIRPLAILAGASGATGTSRRSTERLVRYTRDLAQRSGSVEAHAFATMASGVALYMAGRFREADEQLTSSGQILQDPSLGLVYERVSIRMFSIWSLAYLGRFKDLRQSQREALHDARLRGDVYAMVNLAIGIANMRWLVEDRPDLAESETHAAMQHWPTAGFHMEHYFALVGRIAAGLYVGDVETSHALAAELLARTRASLLWRLQNFRLRAINLHAASCLAMLEQSRGDRTKLLREVVRGARSLERADLAWMRPFAAVLSSGVLLRQGARDRALIKLETAAHDFSMHGLSAYAAAARDRAARLRGNAAGALEINRVTALLKAEDVVAPERMIAMLLPGMLP